MTNKYTQGFIEGFVEEVDKWPSPSAVIGGKMVTLKKLSNSTVKGKSPDVSDLAKELLSRIDIRAVISCDAGTFDFKFMVYDAFARHAGVFLKLLSLSIGEPEAWLITLSERDMCRCMEGFFLINGVWLMTSILSDSENASVMSNDGNLH